MLCCVAIDMDVKARSNALNQRAWVVHGSEGAEYVEKDPITTPDMRAAYIWLKGQRSRRPWDEVQWSSWGMTHGQAHVVEFFQFRFHPALGELFCFCFIRSVEQ